MSEIKPMSNRRLPGEVGRFRSLALLASTSWRADRLRSLGSVATIVVDQVGALIALYALKLLVVAATHHAGRAVWWGVLIALGVAASYAANAIGSTVSHGLMERTAMAFEARILALVASLPGLEHFERPELLDRIELVRQERWALGSVVQSVVSLMAVLLQLVGTAVLLAGVTPLLLLLPIAAFAPWYASFRSDRLYRRAEDASAGDLRLAVRLKSEVVDPAAAGELRLHGFGPLVEQRHRDAHREVIAARNGVAVKTGLLAIGGDLVLIAAQLAALVLVVDRAATGRATAGDVVLTVVLALRLRNQVYWMSGSIEWMLRALRTVSRVQWLEDEVQTVARVRDEQPADATVPERLGEGIAFEGVSFRYPGTEVDVLAGVDLFFPAGTTVAVVGENGAGKSTIMKLLCRFYDPSSGRVTVDGIDVRRFPIDQWRERLSGAFQDHARLAFLARESVGTGYLPAIDDEAAVLAAVDHAGATTVLHRLPDGLATQLGARFDDGVELSGGQWQQLALSRGMMRAPTSPLLLLLDEPTAALDAGAEHRLFERYAAAARRAAERTGAITILVSHRFSTVRMADLIVVVADGRVVESGSHDELISAGALYAELYGFQARAYRR